MLDKIEYCLTHGTLFHNFVGRITINGLSLHQTIRCIHGELECVLLIPCPGPLSVLAANSSWQHPSLKNLLSRWKPPCWRVYASLLSAPSHTPRPEQCAANHTGIQKTAPATKLDCHCSPCSRVLHGRRQETDSCWDLILPERLPLPYLGFPIVSSIKHMHLNSLHIHLKCRLCGLGSPHSTKVRHPCSSVEILHSCRHSENHRGHLS